MSASRQAKLFILTRAVDSSPSISVGADFTKHWGLLIEYYLRDGRFDSAEIVEGNRREPINDETDSVLEVCAEAYGISKSEEFEPEGKNRKAAHHTEFVEIPGNNFPFAFCAKFNQRSRPYHIIENNCQTVLKEFLAEIGLKTPLETAKDAARNAIEV